jgi:predicted component of type VI protein secretion system
MPIQQHKSKSLAYRLTLRTIGPHPMVRLTHKDFIAIKKAKVSLQLLLGLEETYDAVLQNYEEYEQELLKIAIRYNLYRKLDSLSMTDDKYAANRRLANVLAVARLYLDQSAHDTKHFEEPGLEHEMACAKSATYDQSLGYRVMEAIRNYIQHRAFPITMFQYHSKWEDREEPRAVMQTTVRAFLVTNNITDDKNFKPRVARELAKKNEHDITPFLRSYIEGLSSIHTSLRAKLPQLQAWRETITRRITNYEKRINAKALGLAVVSINPDSTWNEEISLSDDFLKRLDYLQRKNQELTNYAKRHVSNES